MNKVRSFLRWLGALLTAWGTPPLSFGTDPNGAAVQQLLQSSPFDPDALRAVFTPPPNDWTREREAVRLAAVRIGLPLERFEPNYDLSKTGKLYEVIHVASNILGIDHGLRTEDDVVSFLARKA